MGAQSDLNLQPSRNTIVKTIIHYGYKFMLAVYDGRNSGGVYVENIDPSEIGRLSKN